MTDALGHLALVVLGSTPGFVRARQPHRGDHLGIAVAEQHGAAEIVEIHVFGPVFPPHARADGLDQLRRAMLDHVQAKRRPGRRAGVGVGAGHGPGRRHTAVLQLPKAASVPEKA